VKPSGNYTKGSQVSCSPPSARLRPFSTLGAWRGATARRANHGKSQDWMSSPCMMLRDRCPVRRSRPRFAGAREAAHLSRHSGRRVWHSGRRGTTIHAMAADSVGNPLTERKRQRWRRRRVDMVCSLPIRLSHTRTMGRQKSPVSVEFVAPDLVAVCVNRIGKVCSCLSGCHIHAPWVDRKVRSP
jgi:hypothetical protein